MGCGASASVPYRADAVLAQYENERTRFEQTWTDRVSQARAVLRQRSLEAGIQAAYLLQVFPGFVTARSPDGLGFDNDDVTFSHIFKKLFSSGGWGANMICPRDEGKGCSFVDFLEEPHRGKATHFVSWSWRYTVCQVSSALETVDFKADKLSGARTYLWMNLFCDNQYRRTSKGGRIIYGAADENVEERVERLQIDLGRIGRMIVIMDDYISPRYISSAWRLIELSSAVELGMLKIAITCPQSAESRLKDRFAASEYHLIALKKDFQAIDAEMCVASSQEEEGVIKCKIRDGIGFAKLNSVIHDALRPQILSVANRIVSEVLTEAGSHLE